MGERKVQAKYYPPDFDPSKLPRIKKKRDNDDAVRFMLPMSVRCESCGEFMGTGLKFNARKSDTGDNYLGIRIFRFTMRCTACPSKFTIRTDPKNSDYSCESGVRRNYEPWREKKQAEEEGKEERSRQDEDAMQALENKTLDAKKQMDELDELDDIKSSNARRAAVSIDEVLARGRAMEQNKRDLQEETIREAAKQAFRKKPFAKIEDTRKSYIASKPVHNASMNGRQLAIDNSAPRHGAFGLKVKRIIKKQKGESSPSASQVRSLVSYGSSSDSE